MSFGLFVYSFLDIKYTNYIPNVAIFITAGCNLFFPSFIKALKPPEIRRREESEDRGYGNLEAELGKAMVGPNLT